ncbi:MAG: TonB family protein [Gallionella sp.]|jgi:protein TonB
MSVLLFRFREPLSAAVSGVVMLLLFYSWTPTLQLPAKFSAPIELRWSVTEEQLPAEHASSHSPAVVPAAGRNVIGNYVKESTAYSKVAATESTAQSNTALPGLLPVQGAAASGQAVSSSMPDEARHNAESAYAASVRAHLQAVKRYPTGREASLQRPAGTSLIWFVVRRNGELAEAGIEASSGSMLLDNAALATVRRSNYPVFSDEAWPGKAQQRFTVELNFVPAY